MIEFHPLAAKELRQAQAWYGARSLRTAERFFEQVNRAMERLAGDATSYPLIHKDFRYIPVLKFPFILVYRCDRGNVLVVAVAHTGRRSGYWRRRK